MEIPDHDLEPQIQVITIVIDPSNPAPQVDLGKVHPIWALSILRQVVECLDVVAPEPDITYDGSLIYTGIVWVDDDDD